MMSLSLLCFLYPVFLPPPPTFPFFFVGVFFFFLSLKGRHTSGNCYLLTAKNNHTTSERVCDQNSSLPSASFLSQETFPVSSCEEFSGARVAESGLPAAHGTELRDHWLQREPDVSVLCSLLALFSSKKQPRPRNSCACVCSLHRAAHSPLHSKHLSYGVHAFCWFSPLACVQRPSL